MQDKPQEILEDLHSAENKCQQFEKQYGLLSEYFFDAYSNGWLADDGNLDFAEWAGYYKSKLDRLRRYRALIKTMNGNTGTIPRHTPMTQL